MSVNTDSNLLSLLDAPDDVLTRADDVAQVAKQSQSESPHPEIEE